MHLWHYSEVTRPPWRLISPAALLFSTLCSGAHQRKHQSSVQRGKRFHLPYIMTRTSRNLQVYITVLHICKQGFLMLTQCIRWPACTALREWQWVINVMKTSRAISRSFAHRGALGTSHVLWVMPTYVNGPMATILQTFQMVFVEWKWL